MNRLVRPVLLIIVLTVSCITDPDVPDLPIEIVSVLFTGDSIWQEPSGERLDVSGTRTSTCGYNNAARALERADKGPVCMFTITWTPYRLADFASYRVYRSTQPDIPAHPDDRQLLGTIYTDSVTTQYDNMDLEWETAYYYRVLLQNIYGKSWWSNEVMVTSPQSRLIGAGTPPPPGPFPPPKPSIWLTEQSWDTIEIKWTSCTPEYFVGYTVYRSETPLIEEDPSLADVAYQSASVRDTTYSDSGLPGPAIYYYAMKLDYFGGGEVWSQERSAETSSEYPSLVDGTYGFYDPYSLYVDRILIDPSGTHLYLMDRILYGNTCFRRLNLDLQGAGGYGFGSGVSPGPFDLVPDGPGAFVAENKADSSRLLEIDTSNMSLMDAVDVPETIRWIQVTPSGEHVYLLYPGRIDVHSTVDLSLVATIPSELVQSTSRLLSQPGGDRMYCTTSSGFLVLDTKTHSILSILDTGWPPLDAVCTSTGDRLYAIYVVGLAVAYDLPSGNPLWTTVLGEDAGGICLLQPEEKYIYITSFSGYTPVAWVLDSSDGSVLYEVPNEDDWWHGDAVVSSIDGDYMFMTIHETFGFPGILRIGRELPSIQGRT